MSDTGQTIFYKNLESEMRLKRITKIELAKRLGVSKTTVQKYTTGECYPSVKRLIALSQVLGVSIDSLLTGRKPKLIGQQKVPFEGKITGEIIINFDQQQ